MGFQPEPRIYKLVFEDPALRGLEVIARSVTVGEFMEVTGLDDVAVLGGVTLNDAAPLRPSILAKFAGCLVEWNLGPDGAPLPATLATLRKQELGLVRAMVRAWLEAVSGVVGPLPSGSPAGGPAPEESLNLASLSQSLPS